MGMHITAPPGPQSPARLSDFDIEAELERAKALMECVYLGAQQVDAAAVCDALQFTTDAAQNVLRTILAEMEARRGDHRRAHRTHTAPAPLAMVSERLSIAETAALQDAGYALIDVIFGFLAQPRFGGARDYNGAGEVLEAVADTICTAVRLHVEAAASSQPTDDREARVLMEIQLKAAMNDGQPLAAIAAIASRAVASSITGGTEARQ